MMNSVCPTSSPELSNSTSRWSIPMNPYYKLNVDVVGGTLELLLRTQGFDFVTTSYLLRPYSMVVPEPCNI